MCRSLPSQTVVNHTWCRSDCSHSALLPPVSHRKCPKCRSSGKARTFRTSTSRSYSTPRLALFDRRLWVCRWDFDIPAALLTSLSSIDWCRLSLWISSFVIFTNTENDSSKMKHTRRTSMNFRFKPQISMLWQRILQYLHCASTVCDKLTALAWKFCNGCWEN